MANPWETILLSDYENHMKLDTVMQLQRLNQMMKRQLNVFPVKSVIILGIAGSNGLKHIDKNKYKKVYGVDINRKYLAVVGERYSDISEILECVQLDITNQKAVEQVQPKYVSCIIQINAEGNWVSDSPYIHVFDDLDSVHHLTEEEPLVKCLNKIGYRHIDKAEKQLPNGKKLVQLDFEIM